MLVISLLNGMLYIPGDQMVWLIVGIALDLVCVIIGSLLWKKANRIDPASAKNKLKFFLWNNLGVIASIIAFLPLIIILLKNKDLDARTKKIVTVVAAIALVAAAGFSIDYDPVSQEELDQAVAEMATASYAGPAGAVLSPGPGLPYLLNSSIVYQGSIEEAFEANRHDPCDFCRRRRAE